MFEKDPSKLLSDDLSFFESFQIPFVSRDFPLNFSCALSLFNKEIMPSFPLHFFTVRQRKFPKEFFNIITPISTSFSQNFHTILLF